MGADPVFGLKYELAPKVEERPFHASDNEIIRPLI
jgi:hypothetical protein